VDSLVEYWEEYGATSNNDFSSPQLSPFTLAQRKARAFSTATLAMDAKQTLPAFHPALAILDYIDIFGPLIFPLHRAALLRKRILLIASPPLRQTCEFGMSRLYCA
jgi:DENN domain-containing protein 11